MKQKKRWRFLALGLCIAALLSGSALAMELGEPLEGYSAELCEGLRLHQGSYWTGSDYRRENYVELRPDSRAYPLAVSRDPLCSRDRLEVMAAQLEAEGLQVLAGINGDYFNMSSLIPVGVVIEKGILRSSCDGVGAVGFTREGKTLLGRPELRMVLRLETEEQSYEAPLEVLNKARGKGFALYTGDFAETTGARGKGRDFICVPSGELRADCDVTLSVESVLERTEEDAPGAIPPDRVLLSLSDEAGEGLLEMGDALLPGRELHLQIRCAEGWERVDSALGSLYKLVTDGVVEEKLEKSPNPRTAVGLKGDGTLVLYTIDGRQSGYSTGASMEQLARRMLELGCVEAGALDGGGSTTLHGLLPGDSSAALISRPSEGTPRQVVSGLFLVREALPVQTASALVLYPLEGIRMLPGAEATLRVKAVDKNGQGVPVPEGLGFESTLGRVEGDVFHGLRPGTEELRVFGAGLQSASIPLRVVETPDELRVYGERYGREVKSLTLDPGQEVDLTAAAWQNHLRLLGGDECFTWAMEGTAGTVDDTGHLIPSETGGESILTVSAGERRLEIPIHVTRPVPFDDVLGEDWFYEAVKFVYKNELFSGTEETLFSPHENMSRAMLATVLWRMSGAPEVEFDPGFTDVAPEAWYAPAVAWAAEQGIVEGVTAEAFAPELPLTREQTAAMLWRFARPEAGTEKPELLEAYPDGDAISDWARSAMLWALERGLIGGREENRLCPGDNITRSETAAILMRHLT